MYFVLDMYFKKVVQLVGPVIYYRMIKYARIVILYVVFVFIISILLSLSGYIGSHSNLNEWVEFKN